MQIVLLGSIFIISTCGLIYELVTGALASYLLGDSVTQFSTIIGVYLFAMGIGSYLAQYVTKDLLRFFIRVEFLIGLVGGSSAAILFLLFEQVASFRILLYAMVSIIGILVGFEIPILMRLLKEKIEFDHLVSKVFTFDYVGALVASLLFPLLLVPHLGLVRSSLLFGILNSAVGLWTLFYFRQQIRGFANLCTTGILVLLVLVGEFLASDKIMAWSEAAIYPDPVIYSHNTPYQRIVITKKHEDLRLFLNGNLQFSSADEYRYHEALVHVGMASLKSPKRVLIMGGGDGLALREVLKYPSVEAVTLVDLDPTVTHIFSRFEMLSPLNQHAFEDHRVTLVNADAFIWLQDFGRGQKNNMPFDFVILDFPDPGNYSVGKLFSKFFYQKLKSALADHALVVVQSTSPLVAKKTYWCVVNTLKSAGYQTWPYHALVPSFGEWGFILAGRMDSHFEFPSAFPEGLRFVSAKSIPSFFEFPQDMSYDSKDVNRLNNQVLVRHFEEEWSRYGP